MAVFLAQNASKIVCRPGPARGAYSAPPDPLAGFKEHTSKEGEGKAGEVEEGRRGEGSGDEGREREGKRSGLPPTHNFWLRH